ncbi:hypothetical protein GIB67_018076 [Kingdonia uniflora]|uniref:Leucine-rich repeat-containing N-terminal plant-type domain-containing protein n=1 Tax=Kingdonia uniflora TaxID=39325 RepID=A0A7J7NX39_9MAGN|nr:hypothetical protein GIB67_018076 [Kingdonia uniflora]
MAGAKRGQDCDDDVLISNCFASFEMIIDSLRLRLAGLRRVTGAYMGLGHNERSRDYRLNMENAAKTKGLVYYGLNFTLFGIQQKSSFRLQRWSSLTLGDALSVSSWRGTDCCQWDGIRCNNNSGVLLK